MSRFRVLPCLSILLALAGCSNAGGGDAGDNPFLDGVTKNGKADTDYHNPDGVEVEVDVEGDLDAPSYRRDEGPAQLAQFAMTYLRERGEFYLESLAEDVSSEDRVEWRVDGAWITAAAAKNTESDKLTHFRIRGVNAILLNTATTKAMVGSVFTAKVPAHPYTVMTDAGSACANPNGHIDLSQSVYWYLWNPDKTGCDVDTADLTVTVASVFPQKETYPEYDRLTADGKITAVILYGQIGDGPIDDTEIGVRNMKRMMSWLTAGGFSEVTPVELGRRFAKTVNGVTVELDLYAPTDFSGLGDYAHFDNLQTAISEHEIVVYDGHSMLGASDFWNRPAYPDFYQIFIYGGCLGYEYYVRPILNGKGGWTNLDIVSSVVEVSASANEIGGPFLSQLLWSLDHGNRASWRDLLVAIRDRVGDSTFGASGVDENCFSPEGSLCEQ